MDDNFSDAHMACLSIAVCYSESTKNLALCLLLNFYTRQAPARARFLKIDPVRIVGMHVRVCMCVSTPEVINN